MSLSELFHPAVANWFADCFAAPTPAQAQAWPAIKAGRDTLIAAPTGSGKTLAAFLAAIDGLVRQGLEDGLPDATQVVYVSPLKALSNDIHRNLEAPLCGVRDQLRRLGLPDVDIRAGVRSGDTPTGERERMRRRPPHILVTTPESLYVMLGSDSGRRALSGAQVAIVDEIHAIAAGKRGVHLALSLERLDALCGRRLVRIGLSATQNPVEEVARLLAGAAPGGGDPAVGVTIVDTGHRRRRDLAIEVPGSPLEAVMSGEVWTEVFGRLVELVEAHRTTLVFVNTRRMAERVARELSERMDEGAVTAHHGSMAKEHRLAAEQRLKHGGLRALVATASLELGIDIGAVDLVCQLGSPRSIASFLQRVGRSGHAVGGTSRGRLFPLSRDDLVESAALLDSVRRGELDRLVIPRAPLDVLAQQITAEVAAQDWPEAALYDLARRAWPFRDLTRSDFDAVVRMLAEGFTTRRGRTGALVHRDGVHGILRARRGARITALTSGGTIPDTADYRVVLEPEAHVIGSVNEDFAVESMAGDVFQLGNRSYRILRVERGTVRVEDACGQPPTIPFWLGEAPGRSDELSVSVSRLRAEATARLAADPSGEALRRHLADIGIAPPAAQQAAEYLASAAAAFGCLPTRDTLVLERFFDEAGGMQLVIHAPFGSRVNRAFGLALRKRFCRKFNFELQAAATEDAVVLSLTTAHSFELAEVARYLNSASVRHVLIQAMLDAPMFTTRWRWVAQVALALPRFRGGRKVPPQLVRMQAEDLIAAVFPDQIACAENLAGEREIPDHPLTGQAIQDCLHEGMDIEGLERLLRGMESGAVRVVACDLTEPSPLSLEALAARPYAFLDDAPLEERRTQAVMARRWHDPRSAADLGRLDPEAIVRVREEAWPDPANAEELHDALLWLGCLTAAETAAGAGWHDHVTALGRDRRATRLDTGTAVLFVAAERLQQFAAVWPGARRDPDIAAPSSTAVWSAETALPELLRGRLEGTGPVTAAALAAPLGLDTDDVRAALTALETEGSVMRGRFVEGVAEEQWCDRRLLARVHRYTVQRLRAEIEPVAAADFMRFLFAWQHVDDDARLEGGRALPAALAGLAGFEAQASAWETEILPARVEDYEPAFLDAQCLSGQHAWARLVPPKRGDGQAGPVRSTPIVIVARRDLPLWRALGPAARPRLSHEAQAVHDALSSRGALFFEEVAAAARLLRSQAEDALGELVAAGLVSSDSFGGLRALLVPSARRPAAGHARRRGRVLPFGMEGAGRWSVIGGAAPEAPGDGEEAAEHVARALLARWGVVFWRLLAREADWLPPWRDLLRVYRRLEARGEIRGGRFVAGFSGEQYALPEAVGLLRQTRRRPAAGRCVSLSGADPLNLVGILTPGARLPAVTGNRVLWRDGVPAAVLNGGKVQFLVDLDPAAQWEARTRLLRSAAPAMMADLA